jgi:Flp pilus assembly secretin CpaC
VLRAIALWGLAAATTVTVVQRIVEVRRQAT